jgi:tetratricopeptide (TPR) repeat protein
VEAWVNYGLSLLKLNQIVPAREIFQKATELAPHHGPAWSNLALAFERAGDLQNALVAADRAVAAAPDLAEAYYNRANVLDQLEQSEDALVDYQQALAINPHYAAAWNNLGAGLAGLDRDEEAIAAYRKACELNPDYAQAWKNLAEALLSCGTALDAERSYEQALSIDPAYPEARTGLAQVLLRQGKFAPGFDALESRWLVKQDAPAYLPTQQAVWSGAASDLPLLLWGEQGIGDQILYASILPELAGLPQKKYVALDKRLLPLFSRSMPGFEFVDLATVSDALGFAEQLPLGSLPRLFRHDLASFASARHPYLQADVGRSTEMRHKIAREGQLVCGVSWSSSRKSIGRHKSLSLEQMLAPLASPRLHFVDLQYGDTTAERQALQQAHGIEVQHLDEVDNFHDIDGLAALIQACDVVITTSNSTAHLAGALGKTTLLLLPSGKGQLWYWAEINGTIPWYPSIQTFRQKEITNWSSALQSLQLRLISFLN